MRKFVSKFSVSAFVFFICIIVSALIIALLSFKGLLVGNGAFITTTIVSLLIFFSLGFIFGYKMKKRGLINGLLLAMFYVLFLLLYYGLGDKTITLSSGLIDSSRTILIIFGSVTGVNMAQKRLK